MPTIVTLGKIPEKPTKVYRFSCHVCNTVADFKREEITLDHVGGNSRFAPKVRIAEVKCPLCKGRVLDTKWQE